MKKLSIAIDMGAKNNGVFIVKSDADEIVTKKATNIIVDNINFSKKSRRENRHKDRNYKRRKLAKRLLKELMDFSSFDEKQQESILGLLNNRGYTFLSTASEFESLDEITVEFNKQYLEEIAKFKTKESFEEFFTDDFEDEKELLEFLENTTKNITTIASDLQNFINKKNILVDLKSLQEYDISKFKAFSYVKFLLLKNGYKNLGKNQAEITKKLMDENIDLSNIDFEKELNYINSLEFDKKSADKENSKIIIDDLKELKNLFINIAKEINTGSKPRKKYLKDIKEEIDKLDFIEDKLGFYNLVGNISNLQLRVLRKFYGYKPSSRNRFEILRKYFISHHYKTTKEKVQRKELFIEINKYSDLKLFLQNTPSYLTIPPYEDMNNRDTYKCNSMFIKPSIISDDLKETIDYLLNQSDFEILKKDENGELKKEEFIKTRVIKDNKLVKEDFTYSKYLQRILDATVEITTKEFNPRNVFKHKAKFERGTIDSVEFFKKEFGVKNYEILKPIAESYYAEEEKILSGIYEEKTSILVKCNQNTPYKNNAKHILLKPIYSYNFTVKEADEFLEDIKNSFGTTVAPLKRISEEAKKYQNSFYHIIEACYSDEKCVDNKEVQKIVKDLKDISEKSTFAKLKTILKGKDTYLSEIDCVNNKNLKRVLNIFKQTYEILFKELSGFNKTCKHCTVENSIRSDESLVIGKRLLSDVAKPIDGMLDMMLDRLAFEISENIDEVDIKDITDLEILLEQNKFEFEENLNTIKRANNNQIKRFDKNKYKDELNINICPYTAKDITQGDYDHILPQSKGVYNSKANMIYASVEGNQKIKGARDYTLEMIEKKHLKAIFKTDDINEIKSIIKKGLDSIKKENFTNFDNLKLNQQIALRYALFMRGTEEFEKAFEFVKIDKIKTFSNGTQKRLARFIYEKLAKKFEDRFKNISVKSKVVDNKLVSSTRKLLAVNQETGEVNHLFKEEKQKSHSHCIDAMMVFYLANSKIKNQNSYKDTIIEPVYEFDDIYLEDSGINNLSKNKTFINSPKNEIGSYKLFDDTIYAENYKHIVKDLLKEKELESLIFNALLFETIKGKKTFVQKDEKLKDKTIYKIDVQKTSNLLHKCLISKDKETLNSLKFLDKLRYSTSRKEISAIFFDDKQTKLLEFSQVKSIPYFSENLYRAVYKKLQSEEKLFNVNDDGKTTLNIVVLNNLLKDMFLSKQSQEYKEKRKRGKKRHKYTLPVLGSPKFRIKRGNTWQVLGNKDIATKNYIINANIKPIPFFSKNTIPLKVSDLLDCLLLDENTQSVYEVEVNISEIEDFVSSLKYFVTESKRCTVQITFKKSSIKNIDFSNILLFDGVKDKEFKKLLENYIENKELVLNKYIGSIRDGLKAKATLLDNKKDTITLQYKAGINSDKKQIILDNLKD